MGPRHTRNIPSTPLPCRIRAFTAEGRLTSTSIIEDHGYAIGSIIQRKADDTVGTIQSMTTNTVLIECDDGLTYRLSVDELISGAWKHRPKTKEREVAKDTTSWVQHMETAHTRSQVLLDMHKLIHGHPSVHDGVTVYSKPKGVHTCRAFPKGQLQLVPITNKVEIESEDHEKTMPPRALKIDAKMHDGYLDQFN